MAQIYLSSTYADLAPYRDAIYRSLRQMRHDVGRGVSGVRRGLPRVTPASA